MLNVLNYCIKTEHVLIKLFNKKFKVKQGVFDKFIKRLKKLFWL